MTVRFEVDPDLRFAAQPPSALHVDAAWHSAIADRVLARTWHVVATAHELAAKEHAVAVTLLPGALDEPLVLTRDRKERLHCLANSCTDGGELVCTGAGPAKLLRCPAHGRTFRLDGELMDAPGFEGAAGFPSPADSLARLPVATWGPLVFASLAPMSPFEDLVRPLRELGVEVPDSAEFVPAIEEIDASWTLCVEHALRARFGQDAELLPSGVRAAAGGVRRFWLFPATFVEVRPAGVVSVSLEPVAVGRTRVRRYAFLPAGAEPDAAWFDAPLLALFQRGLRSRSRRPGPYAPLRDRAVHHFHRLLAAALGSS